MLPTSRRAVESMLAMAELGQAELVAELGAGTGSHTRAILSQLGARARLVAFEIDPAMAATVRERLPDPRLEVVTASAEELEHHLDGQRPQVVVSALPFTSLPAGAGTAILDRTARTLAPGGVLLVLQYSPLITSELTRRFGWVRRKMCLRNVPPAFLFACRDPRPADDGQDAPGLASGPSS
ncbi:class I SAM-dependent methyltransferase [Egibacter rhizosphaerae]|uniref:class I SAM-dependent methyltransferase n=1 Tax=Egibacter rhizosphaerae TaxID=1670831 RepID=UPI00197ADF8A|nr:methyltransferase domain-containing protein [Egibacter rhizosphaerae]